MFSLVQQSGLFGFLIVALMVLNLGLVLWILSQLLGNGSGPTEALRHRIDGVLFWGAVGALAGFLGQATGLYLASRAISRASEISPNVVMEGLAVSFLPNLMGLLLLLGSVLAWGCLRALYSKAPSFPVSV